MKILVTGGTGFLGSALVRRLVKEGHAVRVLCRKSSNKKRLEGLSVEWVEGDLIDAPSVGRAVAGCEVVFHCGAVVSYWRKDHPKMWQTNVIGTKHVVEACLKNKVRRLVHVSSILAIAEGKNGERVTERTPYNFAPYKIVYCDSKYQSEQAVLRGVKKGLNAVIVNPGAIFGAGLGRGTGRLVFYVVSGGRFSVPRGIGAVHIDDVVQGMLAALEKGKTGERYLLVGENLTYRELTQMAAHILEKKPPRQKIPSVLLKVAAFFLDRICSPFGKAPPITPAMAQLSSMKLYFSNEKAKRELGMAFRPLQTAIREAIEWYRSEGILE